MAWTERSSRERGQDCSDCASAAAVPLGVDLAFSAVADQIGACGKKAISGLMTFVVVCLAVTAILYVVAFSQAWP